LHCRITGEPIPEHISARWQYLDVLLDGLVIRILLTMPNVVAADRDAGIETFAYLK
jgi:hypothetical protein